MDEQPSYRALQLCAREFFPWTVRIRRMLHEKPELSGQELNTAALVYSQLSELGLKPRFRVGKTGVSAALTNGSGRTVVLRADMDALPLQELNTVPYRSRVPGVMHACGHDMHTACLLGGARILVQLRNHIKGTVVFLFQPSEETEPGGAVALIREKAFPANADAIFALHVNTEHRTGIVGIKEGDECSGVLEFDVTVTGRGAHGAMPERSIDPIVCGSSMVTALQSLISRECPPFEPAVVTVGSFHAGTKQNIIPDTATFAGTIRTFSDSLQRHLRSRLEEILSATARAHRARVEVLFRQSYPSGYNDPALTSFARATLREIIGADNCVERRHPIMFAEDFAYYQRKVPGVFMHLGVNGTGRQDVPGIHNAHFLPDERALLTGMTAHAGLALRFLGGRRG